MAGRLGQGPWQGAISLDQLIALNDEIAALSRAGMPMERGLIEVGSDLPGRLGMITKTIGAKMGTGESLSEAMESSGAGVPRVYRAVIEAGIRSGRLSVALEGLATYARGFAEARRNIGLALWYPLLVVCLAYVFLIGFVAVVIPRFVKAFEVLGLPLNAFIKVLEFLGENLWYWVPILPLMLVFGAYLWVGSRRAVGFGRRRAFGILRYFPWLGRMLEGYEAASYADLTALLLEHQLPYPDALRLAGDASCDPSLSASSRKLAEAITTGESVSRALEGKSAFPPLLRWVLAGGAGSSDVPRALRIMAGRYRGQANREAEKIRLFLPMILLVGLGVTATLFYSITLFIPLATLWRNLALDWP